jgi:hypothetical protein
MAIELDDFGKMAYDRYVATVDQYNEAVSKGEAVASREKFEEMFLDTAPELAEETDMINRLKEKLHDVETERSIKAQPLITPAYEKALSEVGVDPEAIKELKKKLTAATRFLTIEYGEEVLADAPKAKQVRALGSTGTTGTRRIHGFDVYIDGKLSGSKNKDGVFMSNFASGARDLGIETIELQRAFFEKAGREDYKAEDFPAMVDFSIGDKAVRVTKVDDSADDEADTEDTK